MKRILTFFLLLAALLALWWVAQSRVSTPERPLIEEKTAPTPPPAPKTQTPTAPPLYDPAFDRLNDPATDIETDLRLLYDIFARYRLMVKDPSGNPIGTHREMVRALQGHNRAHLAFLPTEHRFIGKEGDLLDRWGTPFFFHALSSTHVEIRSAGPDRKMWTVDDVLFPTPQTNKPAAQETNLPPNP